MSKSRSKNLFMNVFIGYIAQIGIMLLSFIGRRIFVEFLSVEYLGINGLYGNILSVLAIAELGLGNVTQFFLYKPIAEGKYSYTNSLFGYFKKLYTIIAVIVLLFGLALIPFLKYIVNGNLNQIELIIYYVLFLLNSVVTYFSAPHISLLAASQDNRLHKIVTLFTSLILTLLHIVVLLIFKNYMVYVVATLITTILNVVIINILCGKKYPYIKKAQYNNELINKIDIINKLKATFVYKIGAVIVNNTDNILISLMVGTTEVGLYSNYYMPISAIQTCLAIITTSLISGIGNLSANGNKNHMYKVFKLMIWFYHFIGATFGILLYFLVDEFISLWLGREFVMNKIVVFAIAMNFYTSNVISPVWMFRETNGLFEKVKYLLLCTALVNVIASVVLGNYMATAGILLATSIARILTQVWYEPNILIKNVFNKSQKEYWIKQGKYFLVTVVCFIICYFISGMFADGIIFVIIKTFIFFIVCSVMFLLASCKDEEFYVIKSYIYSALKTVYKFIKGEKEDYEF